MRADCGSRRVLVTGARGFVGSHVVDRLVARRGGRDGLATPGRAEADLRDFDACLRVMEGAEVVIHLAADTGGLGYTRQHPATQFANCSLIDLNVFRAAQALGVARLVALGSVMGYSERASVPFREEAFLEGQPSDTHLGYALAKRNTVLLCRMFHREFGLDCSVVVAANAYGPRDHFDASRSNVIPATIAKCHHDRELVVWGDGRPTRDFVYVGDLADAILRAVDVLPAGDFVNLGSGVDVSIGELVRTIVKLSGFTGAVTFDVSRANGDVRRLADVSRARSVLQFTPRMPLEDGLKATIDWYRARESKPLA